MDEDLRVDGMRTWRVDRAQDRFDLSVGCIRSPECASEPAAQGLDIDSGDIRNLHFDPLDLAIRFLADAVSLDPACGGTILHG